MVGFKYQLKNISKDKMAIISFFLPIIIAFFINLLSANDLVSVIELRFAILHDNIPKQIQKQLSEYGTVTKYDTEDELFKAVNNPVSEVIAVIYDGNTLRSIISGDETTVTKKNADMLPNILSSSNTTLDTNITMIPRSSILEEFKHSLNAMTLIIAMFMGCVFNAINIISEKEDGISFINAVLPQTRSQYILQKTLLGFFCGCITVILTACLCMNLTGIEIVLMGIIALLSTFIAALIGLFIGKFTDNLMVGIVYIKIVMLFFIAVPLVAYLMIPQGSVIQNLFYIIPSYGSFNGIMQIIHGQIIVSIKDILFLIVHCVILVLTYFALDRQESKKKCFSK